MRVKVQSSSGSKYVTKIAIAIIASFVITYLFKVFVYDQYIGVRTFPDYGPSLFAGGQPDMLLYLYVILVITSVLIGWVLTAPSVRIPYIDRWAESGKNITMTVTLLLMLVTVIVIGAVSGDVYTPHHKKTLIALVSFGVALFVASRAVMDPVVTELTVFAKRVIAFVFTAIVLYHLPKIPVLTEIFTQSGMKYEARGLFLGLISLSAVIGYLLARARQRSEWMLLSLVLASIYVISIRESWIYWGLDAFHEGESFLTANYLINGPYKFPIDFFPFHGLGRNILHGYFAAFVSENNLYIYRVAQALVYPFVHVLVAAFLYRYTKSVAVSVAFFVLTYLSGFLEERDISPFLLVAFLLIPHTINNSKKNISLQIATGIVLFIVAIYSLEFFIFLNIAMVATLVYYPYIRFQYGQSQIPWVHIGFYISALLFFVMLGSNSFVWLDALRNALGKSPNLMERSLDLPADFSGQYFLVTVFFAPFMLFFVSNVVAYLRKPSRIMMPKDMLVVMFSMLSLVFFVRAFNRSDIGHVLYAYSISIPAIVALAIHYKYISERFFLLCALVSMALPALNYMRDKQLDMDILRQRPLYDARLSVNDVRALQDFGDIQVPTGTINDSHMTKLELVALQSLVSDGYKVFDMTNQPVLIYGAVKSPLITNDIHTMFYNTYDEQIAVIERLKDVGKTVILWSGNHWSETLDSTYVEYRLPVLSEYLLSAYPLTYRVGRFVIFSQQPLPVGIQSDGGVRNKYELGLAPSRMGKYKHESASILQQLTDMNVKLGGEIRPDALIIDVDATGGGRVDVELYRQAEKICVISFVLPGGNSKNFVRLSNLPDYVRYGVDEVKVSRGDKGSRINTISLMKLD